MNTRVKLDIGRLRCVGRGSYVHFYTDNYDVLMNTPKYHVLIRFINFLKTGYFNDFDICSSHIVKFLNSTLQPTGKTTSYELRVASRNRRNSVFKAGY